MPDRSCPECARRLPYAGRRCIHCGWSAGRDGSGRGAAIRLRGWVVSVVLGLILLAGAGVAYQRADAIADWYASFAARHLPPAASSLAPASTPTGAFFYCARQVSRRLGELSVETYPSQDESRLIELGPERYRIEASVLQSLADGRSARVHFVCTTHFDDGRWVLDELSM